jgi:ATP-GRASP peptide maturase of grasp-with-spasm system
MTTTKNTILIASSESDQSTSAVMDWLLYYNSNVIRLNGRIDMSIESINFRDSKINFKFRINDYLFDLNDIKAFWFRRGYFNFTEKYIHDDSFKEYLNVEYTSASKFAIKLLESKCKISFIHNKDINKCIQLELAQKLGLKIPETLITTRKSELISFFLKEESLITKSIQGQLSIDEGETLLHLYTSRFTKTDLENLDENFGLTKFQKEIIKEYEVRSFYFDNKFYSMAIFSQNNEKTQVDFREYDLKTPNRYIRYKLPNKIEKVLRKFMKTLDLLSGSLDLVVDKNGDYIFLEVNPVGQFGMVSIPCNYNLEKIIAHKLINS